MLQYADQTQVSGSLIVPATPVAEDIVLGWQPRYVRAVNVNDLTFYEWFDGMADASSLNTANHGTTQIALTTTNGITVNADGFTLGTRICDTAADVVRWVAIR